MVQQTKQATPRTKQASEITSNKRQSNMSYQKKESVDTHKSATGSIKKDVRGSNGNSTGFRTDVAISGGRSSGHLQRELQPWKPDGDVDSQTFGSTLETSTNGGEWDQFAVNEKLFNVKSNYDETFYTTAINRNAPDFEAKMAAADRKAAEIMRSSATNSHVRDERTMNHHGADDGGGDEEDKFSGVLGSDFPPLAGAEKSNKYVAPARRMPTGSATVKGAPVDPAIVHSLLSRPKAATENSKPSTSPAPGVPRVYTAPRNSVATPPVAIEVKDAPIPEMQQSSPSTAATDSPSARLGGTTNATATVATDVSLAFKNFAQDQRNTVNTARTNKAKADKQMKLSDLKRFSETFKLNSPVPKDLVPIIAKDPAKQREIQEKSRLNEEKHAREKLAKQEAGVASASASPAPSDVKTAQRPAPAAQSSGPGPNTQTRQAFTRNSNGPAQSFQTNQNQRGGFLPQGQNPHSQQQGRGMNPQTHNNRNRAFDQGKDGRYNNPASSHESRPPPTGPSGDGSFSRRSSGATSLAKLNPNIQEFKPNAFAQPFNPLSAPSSGSSPRTGSAAPSTVQASSSAGSLMSRFRMRGSAKPFVKTDLDVLQKLFGEKMPTGPGSESKVKAWTSNGNMQPAYDTLPTWRAAGDNEPAGSSMLMKYTEVLTRPSVRAMSPLQQHANPQVAHQHQLPFHLQQGAHNVGPRSAPRPQPMHSQNHMHGPNGHYNNGDDHRMMASQSAQSFASPRLQQVGMAYPSPMGQPAQMSFNQNAMQFPMNGPQTPQMGYRSYSGGPQFIAQQSAQMGGPVMIQGPGGPTFMGPGGPQMMYPSGQFMQGPPMMPGTNGYPSPGRGGAPMMMQQGSQQGHQSGYGMSPAMGYQQPVYNTQPPPGQIQNMRGFQGGQQFNTSPQMNHQFNQGNRGPNGNFNKNNSFQQYNQPPSAHQNQTQTTPQARSDGSDDTK